MAAPALPSPPALSSASGAAPARALPANAGWLLSRRADFWLACSGGALLIALFGVVLHFRGARELDVADFLLSEFHIGATYEAVVRRRLWKRMPVDVLLVPALVIAATFALMLGGRTVVVNTALLYLAVWHRGRQDYGVAKYYQRQAGGAVDAWHERLFTAAIYLPMLAGILFYTRAFPHGDGESTYYALPFTAHPLRAWLDRGVGVAALASVAAYLAYTARRKVHAGERWVVLAHAAVFGSSYLLAAWNATFVILVGIHHELQYLYFAYAMARRDPALRPDGFRRELRLAWRFALFPLLGLALTVTTDSVDLAWLAPLGEALLLAHYWLDGRIWTGAAMRPAPVAARA